MENTAWNLEDFVDSLVVELDKTRETLSIKAINKPLTYTVKDLAIDLNIFPTYDGDQIKFITAQPGQEGASKVTIQLGSITDQQVRATSKAFTEKNDVSINEIEVDKTTKKQLRKMGVTSADDLKKIEKKNIKIDEASDHYIDYTKLANQIQKAKRNAKPPVVRSVSLSMSDDRIPYLVVKGEQLAVNEQFKPVVVVNDHLADVTAHTENEIKIKLTKENNIADTNHLIVTLDPYAIVKLNVNV